MYLRVLVDDASVTHDETTNDALKEDFVYVSRQDVVGKVFV